MSGVSNISSCNGQFSLNLPACVEVLCMNCVVHRTPYSQNFLGTLFIIIVWKHRLRTSLITPSDGFWFGLSGSVLVNDISFLRQYFMNSNPGMFRYFNPSTVSYSGTPRSVTKIFSDCPTSAFLAIGYISAKYLLLEKSVHIGCHLMNLIGCP